MAAAAVAAAPRLEPLPVRPLRWLGLAIWTALWTLLAVSLYKDSPHGLINWYSTVAWTAPTGIAVVGLLGAYKSGQLIREEQAKPDPGKINDPLDVVLITLGKRSVLGALTRSVTSLVHFNKHFRNATVYVVTEERAEALPEIEDLCTRVGQRIRVKLLVVPKGWESKNKTRFKARAAQYALEYRLERMSDPTLQKHWTYNLDDDTGVEADTVLSLATAIKENRHAGGLRLFQGILVFRREDSPSWLMWLADAIRPGDDMGRFAWNTGRGRPRNGLHGENMLVHTTVLKAITWDFGFAEIVEDSRLAIEFCKRYKGKSGWITARCYGASPVSMIDFVKQRSRWAEGMMGLAFRRDLPLADRAQIMHNMIIWSTGILQPAMVVFGVSWLVKDYNVAPISPWFAAAWVLSVSYTCWIYYSGLWINARASGRENPRVIDLVAMLLGIFLCFSVLEGLGGTIGAARHVMRYAKKFQVIAKPS